MPKTTFSSNEQRAKKGFSDIRDLFRKPNSKQCDGVKRGRRAQNRGRRKAAAATPASDDGCAEDDTRARTKESCKRKKQQEMSVSVKVSKKGNEHNKAPLKKKLHEPSRKRPPMTDWSSPENHAKLKTAVEDWLNNARSTYDDRDPNKKLSLRAFASKMDIPESTLRAYIHTDPKQRKPLGAKSGCPSVVNPEVSNFVAQVAVRADRANEGFTLSQTKSMISDLQPDLSDKQIDNFVGRTFFDSHKDTVKRPVMAQATTTKRSNCTVAEQFRWFNTYADALNFLREKNTGRCRKTGKTFGELIIYFIVAGDESGFIANADGTLRIVGDRKKRKHEKNCADSRASMTLYRTGSVAGHNGPTCFVMAGKKRRTGYTDKFLFDNGCEEGSTLVMTENAYMTDEAWVELTPHLIRGYRAMQYVCDNPDWWMLEIVDGFSSHVNTLEALQVRVVFSSIICASATFLSHQSCCFLRVAVALR